MTDLQKQAGAAVQAARLGRTALNLLGYGARGAQRVGQAVRGVGSAIRGAGRASLAVGGHFSRDLSEASRKLFRELNKAKPLVAGYGKRFQSDVKDIYDTGKWLGSNALSASKIGGRALGRHVMNRLRYAAGVPEGGSFSLRSIPRLVFKPKYPYFEEFLEPRYPRLSKVLFGSARWSPLAAMAGSGGLALWDTYNEFPESMVPRGVDAIPDATRYRLALELRNRKNDIYLSMLPGLLGADDDVFSDATRYALLRSWKSIPIGMRNFERDYPSVSKIKKFFSFASPASFLLNTGADWIKNNVEGKPSYKILEEYFQRPDIKKRLWDPEEYKKSKLAKIWLESYRTALKDEYGFNTKEDFRKLLGVGKEDDERYWKTDNPTNSWWYKHRSRHFDEPIGPIGKFLMDKSDKPLERYFSKEVPLPPGMDLRRLHPDERTRIEGLLARGVDPSKIRIKRWKLYRIASDEFPFFSVQSPSSRYLDDSGPYYYRHYYPGYYLPRLPQALLGGYLEDPAYGKLDIYAADKLYEWLYGNKNKP